MNEARFPWVDAIIDTAERARAKVPVPARWGRPGGYGGYFKDPDGFVWSVVTAT